MATLAEILRDKMNGKPVTQGWGAVAVISQAALNRSAADDYVQRLNHSAYLPLVKVSLNVKKKASKAPLARLFSALRFILLRKRNCPTVLSP